MTTSIAWMDVAFPTADQSEHGDSSIPSIQTVESSASRQRFKRESRKLSSSTQTRKEALIQNLRPPLLESDETNQLDFFRVHSRGTVRDPSATSCHCLYAHDNVSTKLQQIDIARSIQGKRTDGGSTSRVPITRHESESIHRTTTRGNVCIEQSQALFHVPNDYRE